MPKLNQLVAIESGVKSRVNGVMSETYKKVQHPALFDGFSKKYQPLEDAGEKFPPESKPVQYTTGQILRLVRDSLTELFDVTASKDFANCTARASVVVDAEVVVSDAPVTYLLFLEKQLTDLHTLVSKMPVLDTAEVWQFDNSSNLFRTQPTPTVRTKKVQKPLVLYPATTEHPAQTQLITEDITVGHWEQTKLSGAFPAPARDALITRIEKLQKAVKFAREEANTSEAVAQEIGAKIFGWLLSS